MKEIVLTGDFTEIGRQYGKACRTSIKTFTKMVQLMRALAERPGADFFAPKYRNLPLVLPRFFWNRKRYRAEARQYREILSNHYPESLDMLAGMAEGARVAFDDLLFLNAAAEASLHCTAIAATGSETVTGTPILAMNADEAKGVERFEVVLDIRPETGYRYHVCAMKGVLYFNFGMNEKGLAMAGTFLFVNTDEDAMSRVPMLTYFSLLNRCATVAEAADAIRSLPRTDVGLVIYLADAERFVRVEQNAMDRDIEIVEEGLRWNANIPNSEKMAPFSMLDAMNDVNSLFARNRIKRLSHFSERFRGSFDRDAMHTILSDHGLATDGTHMRSMCMHPKHAGGKQTCASMIADPARQTMRICTKNPCANEVVEYDLSGRSTQNSTSVNGPERRDFRRNGCRHRWIRPRAIDLSATTMIHVPVEELYGYVSDPANDGNWRTGVTESGLTTDPPLELGSEGYVKAGKQVARWKVTAIAPGVSVDWELTEGPYSGTGGYRFEDTDGSTRFTLVANVEPRGLFRLLGPLFARMGRKQNQADVEVLKGLLEA